MDLDRISALPRRSRNTVNALMRKHISHRPGHAPGPLDRLAAVPPVLGTLWGARHEILTFLKTGDEDIGYSLRRRFGLAAEIGTTQRIPADIFSVGETENSSPDATIIIPVFNAANHVSQLLDRLSETMPAAQPVVVVNDGSDDPRIARLLDRFSCSAPNASVIDLPSNGGFVAAVNAGLREIDGSHHAIVLNSDTLPPPNWVARLLRPFADAADIASVSPLSNAAEILSIPRPGIESDLDARLVDALDGVAAKLRARTVALPTGVGFCIALNRRFLDQIGGFDPSFGRGYGEEVDWCQRAALRGGRNVAATNLFVGHAGSASFGSGERKARIARATRRIARDHPDFAHAALAWEQRDPIAPERLALSLPWAAHAARAPVVLFVAHMLGGGAETALQHEIATHFGKSNDPIVILRAGGPLLWRVEVQGPRFSVKGDVDNTETLHRLLAPLGKRHIIYSCAVRSEDPSMVPDTLLELARGQTLDIRLHDFFPISPSWNLIGSNGRFDGIPPLDTSDPVHCIKAREGRPGLTHRAWRDKWSNVIEAANDVTVFAPSGAALIEAAYPNSYGKVRVRPHTLPTLPPRLRAGGANIGVLGGINQAKGGDVLLNLGRKTSRRIVIIGEMDGRYRLPPPHVVHGRYDQRQIADLARRYQVGLWLIPSICPETFSFATHEALATGLPVFAFNMGAQGEAVSQAPNGHVFFGGPDDIGSLSATIEDGFSSTK